MKSPHDKTPSSTSLKSWFHYFGQDQAQVAWQERIRASLGALVGLFCVTVMGKWIGDFSGVAEWVMASLGASALLIFVLPSSPMAQPWAVIGGNTLSALIGITCNYLIGDVYIALPIAASSAILGMFLLRCLHPPAAAVALIAVLGQISSYRYALFPVMIDSALLCLTAIFYNTLTGKTYPSKPPKINAVSEKQNLSRIEAEQKLDELLREYQEVMDVDRAELIKIIESVSSPSSIENKKP